MRASVQSDAGVARDLLAAGSQLEVVDSDLGFTALMFAASQGSTQVCVMFVCV